jgi:hypothetical protein
MQAMRNIFWLSVFLASFSVRSQEKSEIIQQRIEFISEQLESEDIDLTNVIEQLNYFFDHPMNLAPNIRQNNFQGSWNMPMNNVSSNF